MKVSWRKTWYGWFAFHNGRRLSVRVMGYRGKRSYVARVNESARTSPAQAHASSKAAKAEAEMMAVS